MTEQEYNKAPGIRRSLLWEIRRSPAHLKWRMENPPEDTPALIFGQALHAAVLTPEEMRMMVDIAKELERITKELEKARKNLQGLEGKLSNENFVSRAPETVVNAERAKAQKARDLIAGLEQSLAAMQAL